MDAIEAATDPGRFARGRVYYRTGKVIEMRVDRGEIHGTVAGSALYEVTVQVTPYSESEWEAAANLALPDLAATSLASVEARDAAEALVAAEALAELDRRWAQLGLRTFAKQLERNVDAECSCPDYRSMCKHGVALWHAFGEQLSADPTVLVTLFGGEAEVWRGVRRGKSLGAGTSVGATTSVGSGASLGAGVSLGAGASLSAGKDSRAREAASIPLVLLPASAERNLQDRGIEELIDRYWRPIREIRLGEEPLEPTGDFELPMSDLSDLPLCDHDEAARVLEHVYTQIRRAAPCRYVGASHQTNRSSKGGC